MASFLVTSQSLKWQNDSRLTKVLHPKLPYISPSFLCIQYQDYSDRNLKQYRMKILLPWAARNLYLYKCGKHLWNSLLRESLCCNMWYSITPNSSFHPIEPELPYKSCHHTLLQSGSELTSYITDLSFSSTFYDVTGLAVFFKIWTNLQTLQQNQIFLRVKEINTE